MEKIFKIDKQLLFIIFLLSLLGIGTILLSSYHISLKHQGFPYYYSYNYIITIIIGWVSLFVFLFIPLNFIQKNSIFFYLFSLILCLMVFAPGFGKKVSGANRWLEILGFSFQPSEMIKVGLILCLSYMLTFKEKNINSFKKSFIPLFSIIILTAGIISIQPDLSTGVIIFITGFILVYINNWSFTYLFLSLALLTPLLIYIMQYKSYFLSRFIFFTPNIDPFGKGYHIIQALKSYRQGGWFGLDSEKILDSVAHFPDIHTDFTFSLLAKVGGISLTLITLGIFVSLALRCFRISLKQENSFNKNFGLGISILISLEIIIHIIVNIGLAPTTGSVLPFLSYGRTSMIIHFILIGVLLNMSSTISKIDNPYRNLRINKNLIS